MGFVQVRFDGVSYKDYVFKTDLDLSVGESVLCDTSQGYHVATISNIAVDESTKTKATKWIVCKINLDNHLIRINKEKQMAEIKKKMDSRRKCLEQEAVFRLLAEQDSEMAKLLQEYDQLSKEI